MKTNRLLRVLSLLGILLLIAPFYDSCDGGGFRKVRETEFNGKTIEIPLYLKVYDVIVDLRPNSKTFKKWLSFKLNDKNRYSLLIPKGCANAFLTLKDNTILHYYCSQRYNPNYECGVRYNDPAFVFKWPTKVKTISKKDLNFENFVN
jgi:dTDP-4-dehydrorhamnose 3,5-epimerase